jgi:hypothetical protein
LKKSVDENKKLQEDISGLRQENIQLKKDLLRKKYLCSGCSQLSRDKYED